MMIQNVHGHGQLSIICKEATKKQFYKAIMQFQAYIEINKYAPNRMSQSKTKRI